MSKVNLTGLGVALITPFNTDNSIDFYSLGRLVDFQIASGTDYIVALGTTAETPTLSHDEKKAIVSFIVKRVNGKIPIVMGLGGNDTAKLVEVLKSTDFTGVSAILSVSPYYNKPSQEGLFQHYCALAEASPLPIILYNVPGRTGMNISAETTLRLAKTCKNIIAIKEASGNMEQIRAILKDAPAGFDVISGDDAITCAVIESGGIGVISVFANAFPKEMSRLVKSALDGNAESVRLKMDEDFAQLFHLIFVEGNPSGIKCLLSLKGAIFDKLRLPLVPVSQATRELIKQEMKKVCH